MLDHHFSLGAGSLCVDTDALDSDWYSTNYEIGDSLIFPALTIHKALPNLTEDRLRVSLDNRYQAMGDIIAEHMLAPHLNGFNQLSWEDVYRDWESDDLKYYWKNLDLETIPKDLSYSNQGFSEALAMASDGDARAILHLNRIIKRDPTTDQAKAAMAALDAVSATAAS